MTRAMWFVWLLRNDVRDGAALSDAQAQREFIPWWLLWGRLEYPAVFSWSREHAKIAMELVTLENGLQCPRLLVRLHRASPDLQRAFPLRGRNELAHYFWWYQSSAPSELELPIAPLLPEACLDVITEVAGSGLPWGQLSAQVAVARRSCAPQRPAPTRTRRKLAGNGVNLIGFAYRRSGLGEDLRAIADAFRAVGLPHVVIDIDDRDQADPGDGTQMPISQYLRFATSIYCMSAFDAAALYVRKGPDFFCEPLRIGYWPWELPRFPDLWADVYHLVDEIWTGSEFTARAYRANCTKPVHCLPAPVVVPAVSPKKLPCAAPGTFVFTYAFDPSSYMKRKNPIALARAFRAAFPPDDQGVALLLRANGKLQRGPDRRALRQAIGTDRRITVMEATLERTEALALLASCHCLVSPHRAEGFGRNIAEAILLQKPVLATAFSGCLDFLQPGERLSFTPGKVEPGDYPFAEGLEWADPDIADMTAKMQLVRQRMRRSAHDERRRLSLRARTFDRTYSPQAAGQRFAGRLAELGVIEPRPDRLQLRVRIGKAAQPLLIPEATFATGC